MVDLAEGQPVADRRHSRFVRVVDDVRRVEQLAVPKRAHGTLSVVRAQHHRAEDGLVQPLPRLSCDIAPEHLLERRGSDRQLLSVVVGQHELVVLGLLADDVDGEDRLEPPGRDADQPDDRQPEPDRLLDGAIVRTAASVGTHLVARQTVGAKDVVVRAGSALGGVDRHDAQRRAAYCRFADPPTSIDEGQPLAAKLELGQFMPTDRVSAVVGAQGEPGHRRTAQLDLVIQRQHVPSLAR